MRRSARACSSMPRREASERLENRPPPRTRSGRAAQELEEGLGATLVARGRLRLVGVLLGVGELLLRPAQPLLPLALVDVGRVPRLVDEDQHPAVVLDLQVALAL